MTTQRDIRELGSAYDLPIPSSAKDLTSVTRGTPGGELLRRYWQPIAVAAEVKDLPVAVRVLGEDLILFKSPSGRFGLVYPRCVHRGTTLYYGKVEESGIRCGYHGWLFDDKGNCLNQPCELNGGKQLEQYRQPWYPVQERYGLVFAYLGPLDRKPPLPRYDILEHVPEGCHLLADGNTIPAAGPDRMPCNWVQTHENVFDYAHAQVVHKYQFPPLLTAPPASVEFEQTEYGMYSVGTIKAPDGASIRFVSEVILPNIRIVPDPFLESSAGGTQPGIAKCNNVAWTLPIDDTNTQVFTVLIVPQGMTEFPPFPPLYGGKTYAQLDEEGHQRFPGDYEAQVGQGAISYHSEERLAPTDRGIIMFRQIYRTAIKAVQAGNNPPNAFGSDEILVKIVAESEFTPPPIPVS
jgi:nitrite reductase/ring-hydroxylating ferredoxin subunit